MVKWAFICPQSAKLQHGPIAINSIWKDKDCIKMARVVYNPAQAPHLQPKNIHGWFWSGSGARIPATNVTAPGWSSNPWSHTGYLSQFASHDVPQPDNAEYLLQRSGVTVEACLAGEWVYTIH